MLGPIVTIVEYEAASVVDIANSCKAALPPRPVPQEYYPDPARDLMAAERPAPGLCETCGGMIVKIDGKKPLLTQFGCAICWCCYDPRHERVKPPVDYQSAACSECGGDLPVGRVRGRCEDCRKVHWNSYMRGYRQKTGVA